MAQEFGLGRGLSSLIPQKNTQTAGVQQRTAAAQHADADVPVADADSVAQSSVGTVVQTIAITDIIANPHQPRLTFDKEKLAELAASIGEHGILQPLVVTARSDGTYELIAGERRFRAAQRAGLTEVPAIVRDADERQKMELALIENIQRHDLNVIEEAKAYQKLAHTYGLSQEEVAQRVGKSRSVVANRLRLLTLPITILKALSEGTISEGHAKVILSLEDTEAQHALFRLITKEHLTVRQAEVRAKRAQGVASTRAATTKTPVVPAVATAQSALSQALDTRVTITPKGRGGRVVIDYYAPEDLRRLVDKLQAIETSQ